MFLALNFRINSHFIAKGLLASLPVSWRHRTSVSGR